jgi:hypothetical protein
MQAVAIALFCVAAFAAHSARLHNEHAKRDVTIYSKDEVNNLLADITVADVGTIDSRISSAINVLTTATTGTIDSRISNAISVLTTTDGTIDSRISSAINVLTTTDGTIDSRIFSAINVLTTTDGTIDSRISSAINVLTTDNTGTIDSRVDKAIGWDAPKTGTLATGSTVSGKTVKQYVDEIKLVDTLLIGSGSNDIPFTPNNNPSWESGVDSSNSGPSIQRDKFGWVTFSGRIKFGQCNSSTWVSQVFTLPSGWKPKNSDVFLVPQGNYLTGAHIYVQSSSGKVKVDACSGSSPYIHLTGVRFLVE